MLGRKLANGLTRRISKRHSQMPVIALKGSSMVTHRRAEPAGVVCCLQYETESRLCPLN